MKKILRLMSGLFVVAILLSMVSCNREKDPEIWDDDIAPDEVTLRSAQDVVFYGNYVYFPRKLYNENGRVFAKVMMRQNLVTGEISTPCQDPLCTHDSRDCPFYCGTSFFLPQIFGDEWMVIQSNFSFNYYEKGYFTDSNRILYNLKTGEWRRILKVLNPTDGYDGVLFYNGTDLFNANFSEEKEVDENGEEYFPCNVYKHNLKTGKESVVYANRYPISLLAVTQKNIYFFTKLPGREYGGVFFQYYCYNMETGEVVDLSDRIPEGTAVHYVYKNKLYAAATDYATSAIIDMKTGEITHPMGELSDDVHCIFVDEEAVYFATRDGLRALSRKYQKIYQEYLREEQLLEGEERQAKVKECMSVMKEYALQWRTTPLKIWKTDLDGNNLEYICEINNTASASFSVHNGYIYLRYAFIDPETGDIDKPEHDCKISRINMVTGELSIMDELADAQEEKSK